MKESEMCFTSGSRSAVAPLERLSMRWVGFLLHLFWLFYSY